MRNRVNDVEEEPHLMTVIVLLILSASANSKLRNEGVTKMK
jgi:hypothetical protein